MKTRKPENPKTRKPENPKTRKPENPKGPYFAFRLGSRDKSDTSVVFAPIPVLVAEMEKQEEKNGYMGILEIGAVPNFLFIVIDTRFDGEVVFKFMRKILRHNGIAILDKIQTEDGQQILGFTELNNLNHAFRIKLPQQPRPERYKP